MMIHFLHHHFLHHHITMRFANPTTLLVVLLAGALNLISVDGARIFPCPSAKPHGYCVWHAFPEGGGNSCGMTSGIPYCCAMTNAYSNPSPTYYDLIISEYCAQA
ncbi:hypothetical protein PSTT_09929 [Puccinia striiformis]|uniref:Uncharacterized protein n=1 Tax=Puccinia striiformis TaxID=27350 RepID=A0A2S4V6H6_9BASI|nr:hypothetical protein PSTT_09929 [Puccinia striiformis]